MNCYESYLKCLSTLLLILVIGNSCDRRSNNQVEHPVKEKLPEIADAKNILDILSFDKEAIEAEELLSRFELKTELNTKDQLFADASTVTSKVDNNGNTYFVNLDNTSITVFNIAGDRVGSIGRKGRGPGDFEKIRDVAISDSLLVVLDNLEIDIYSINDGAHEYKSSLIHGLALGKEICFSNESKLVLSGSLINKDELLISNSNDLSENDEIRRANILAGLPLHIFDLETQKVKNSVGFSYSSASNWPAFSAILSESRFVCNKSMDILISLNINFGYISAYNFEGDKVWASKLDGYWMRKFTETLQPVPELKPNYEDSPKNTLVQSLNYINEQYVLLQLEPSYSNISLDEANAQSALTGRQLHSILIDSRTGELLPVSTNQGEIILDINANFMVTRSLNKSENSYYLYENSVNKTN